MPFQKGQSGNPGGRLQVPKSVREAARKHTDKAIVTLANCLDAEDAQWPAKVMAANSLLDRAWGKPDSQVNVTGNITLANLLAAMPAATGNDEESAG